LTHQTEALGGKMDVYVVWKHDGASHRSKIIDRGGKKP